MNQFLTGLDSSSVSSLPIFLSMRSSIDSLTSWLDIFGEALPLPDF
jgi:hypothetical protein